MSRYNIYARRLDRAFKTARAEYQARQAAGEVEAAAKVWTKFERERDRITVELEQRVKKDGMRKWNELVRIADFCTGKTQRTPTEATAAGNWWENLTTDAIEKF